MFIRSDGERSLGNNFNDLLVEKGITYESSTTDTPEQNGHSERKGGILAMKARAMRTDAGLPIFLWPEIVCTAGYIANRTPMKKHQWKKPYELVIGNPPDLSHLHYYGCKVYTLNKQLPKKQKLQERAHIGHLVGYEARNIFRVWIPSQRKVIHTRDMMFNENIYYDAHDIDLLQAVNEPMLEITYELHDLDPITLITEIGSDDEEEERGIGMRENIQGTEENMEEIILDKNSKYGYAAEISSDDTYLLTPSPSIISSPTPNSSIRDPNSSESITAKSNKSRKASRNINSSVDMDNILPEGMERSRNRNRRYEAYSTALTQAKNGELNSYHAAFSANIMVSSYYISNQEPKKDHTPTQSTRFHRDSYLLNLKTIVKC